MLSMSKHVLAIIATFSMTIGIAAADSLYVAGPPPAAAGHPLRLGPDHRAQQVGDLVGVQFNFSVQNSSTQNITNTKGYSVALAPATGNAALSFLRFATGLGGNTGTQSANSNTGTNTFVTAMMATVTNVLPSGALEIGGDQNLVINGQRETLHVTGMIRPEDIDQNDTVLSSRIANLDGSFNGNFKDNRGILRRVLDWLF
ncbi:MAG: flagellar basal body L-ring protein FlgH [Candidatus Eremiobacteraeota bacterium]|nr:flagellar basal body L-ring protein FlgH [Candidatus Eremiobacteraeota bacterium]